MKVLVPVKRVPDPEVTVKLLADGSGINMEGVNYVVNPFDEIAVEEALKVKEAHGGEVVILSIGPKESTQQIRTAMAMGADRGILIDGADEALDSDLVARLLAKVCEEEKPDLVLTGKQAVDGDSNQVGQILSTYLDIPQACFASKLVVDPGVGKATVDREVDGGTETLEVTLPAVVTADLRLNEPRYASLPGIMKAKRKPIKEATFADYGVDTTPRVRVLGLEAPPERQAGIIVESVEELVNKLLNEAKVL